MKETTINPRILVVDDVPEVRTLVEAILTRQGYSVQVAPSGSDALSMLRRGLTFDLVLLGMGDDGHTLSLFPGTEVVNEQTAWTKAYFLDQQTMYRLTLTAPIVNRASCVLFLVAGPKKAAPLRAVLEGDYRPDMYPAQVIRPVNGELVWMVDEKAAAELIR